MFERFKAALQELQRDLEDTYYDIKKDREIYAAVALFSYGMGMVTVGLLVKDYVKLPKGSLVIDPTTLKYVIDQKVNSMIFTKDGVDHVLRLSLDS